MDICVGVGYLSSSKVHASCPSLPSLPNKEVKCILPGADSEDLHISYCPGRDYLTPKGTIAFFQCTEDSGTSDSNRLGFLKCKEGGIWDKLEKYYNLQCTESQGQEPFEPQLECGISNYLNISPLINFGVDANIKDWPWFAGIFALGDEWTFICGGTLFNPVGRHLVILTAAHCLTDGINEENLRVILNPTSSDYLDNIQNPISRGNIYQVEKFEINDNYSSMNNYEYDVGVIKLKGKVKLNHNILPACWPGGQDNLEQYAARHKRAILVGFGRTENGELSKTLKLSQMPVYLYKTCDEFGLKASELQFCAGFRKGAAACRGDSGSGLSFRDSTTGKFYVQGIVSTGLYDASQKTCENVGVYTRISMFFLWIEALTIRLHTTVSIFENQYQQEYDYPIVWQTSTSTTYRPANYYTTSVRPKTAWPTYASTTRPTFASSTTRPTFASSTTRPTFASTTRPTFASTTRPTFASTPSPTTTTTPRFHNSEIRPSPSPISEDYADLAVRLHNCYRSRHGAPEVTLNKTLNALAQKWAEHLHGKGYLESKNTLDYVTNEFSTTRDSHDPKVNIQKAVRTWYNQMQYYQWEDPKPNTFSLMVWESVKTIGVSVITFGSKTITVAAYSPPGNVIHLVDPDPSHYFKENVLPLRNTRICSYL